jgi:hypothetical protein
MENFDNIPYETDVASYFIFTSNSFHRERVNLSENCYIDIDYESWETRNISVSYLRRSDRPSMLQLRYLLHSFNGYPRIRRPNEMNPQLEPLRLMRQTNIMSQTLRRDSSGNLCWVFDMFDTPQYERVYIAEVWDVLEESMNH